MFDNFLNNVFGLKTARKKIQDYIQNNDLSEYSKPVREWVADYELNGLRNFYLGRFYLKNPKTKNAVWSANALTVGRIEFQSSAHVEAPAYPINDKDKEFFIQVIREKTFETFH